MVNESSFLSCAKDRSAIGVTAVIAKKATKILRQQSRLNFRIVPLDGGGQRWGCPSFSMACSAPPSLPSPMKGEGKNHSHLKFVEPAFDISSVRPLSAFGCRRESAPLI